MTVTIRLFAILRDRAGISQATLTLPEPCTIQSAVAAFSKAYPAIAGFLPRIAYAINQEYADLNAEVHDGDELAFIPPVSGG